MSRAERIAALNSNNVFLSMEYLTNNALPGIAVTCCCLSLIFTISFLVVDRLVPAGCDMQKKRKVCYQLTNFCANLFLAMAGLYVELFLQEPLKSPEHSVQGFEEYQGFSNFQLGYQAWAIPVGVFIVGERPDMLVHHLAVVFVSSMSGLMTNGFRYWTPFFYGVIELSSVPLAIMNTFKDNPAWIKHNPTLFLAVRLVFALSFLYIRLIMFIPRQYLFLRDHYLLFSTASDNLPYQIFMSIVFTSSALLQLLQIYWGFLIMKGLIHVIVRTIGGGGETSEEAPTGNGVKKHN